jgi:4-hydroxy-2-oxoheptanedioate aldolase
VLAVSVQRFASEVIVVPTLSLKAKLRAGEAVLGTFVHLNDPGVVEIAGAAGLDFVIIDTEHSAKDISVVENMVRASEAFGVASLVRVHANEEKVILRALETGTKGIVIPFIEEPEDVVRARAAMTYPPEGIRGTCTVTRAAHYGAFRPQFDEHAARSNQELLLVGLIESKRGVENISEILESGLDVAFLGRGDLASGLGVPGQSEHPLVHDAVDRVLNAVSATTSADQWCGIMPYYPDESRRWFDRGCPFLAYSVDTYVLFNAYREAVEAAKGHKRPEAAAHEKLEERV